MKTIANIGLIVVLTLMTIITGCKKDDIQQGEITIKMTDAPADFIAVNVEVLQVNVHYANNPGTGWITLQTNAGIYNLLDLQNNVTAVLANNQTLSIGRITQMRLILGQNNTVATTDTILPLELSSQDQTGLKINSNFEITSNGNVEIVLDFDAEKSIVDEGNGTYKLKPVIFVKNIINN